MSTGGRLGGAVEGQRHGVANAARTRAGRVRPAVWFAERSAGVAVALVMGAAYLGLTLVGVLTGLLLPSSPPAVDEVVTRALVERRGPTVDTVAGAVGALTAPSTVLGLAGGVLLVLLLLRRWSLVVVPLVALPLELAVFLTVSLLVDRDRPDVEPLETVAFTSSYPSGHVAAAVALYGSLAWLVVARAETVAVRRLAVALAVVAPLGVGAARVQHGMHHATDVLAGLALGAATLAIGIACAGMAARRGVEDEGRSPG